MKNIFCFHHNDMDGYASASVVYHKESLLGNGMISKDFCELNHNKKKDNEKLLSCKDYRRVYVVDYSFSDEQADVLKELCESNNEVIWIDHHISSSEFINNNPEIKNIDNLDYCFVMGYSGAALCWYMLMIPEELYNFDRDSYDFYNEKYSKYYPEHIKLVSDYDTFTLRYDNSESFRYGYDYLFNNPDFINRYLDLRINMGTTTSERRFTKILAFNQLNLMSQMKIDKLELEAAISHIVEIGETIKNYIQLDSQKAASYNGYEAELEDGTIAFVINKNVNAKMLGDIYKKYDVIITWTFNGEQYSYAVYSYNKPGQFDCSKYAKLHGGGGHVGAAGFMSDKLEYVKRKV